MSIRLTLQEVHDLALQALRASGTDDGNAESVAASVAASEADGIHSHGLARLPTYCEHARCGKIDGTARPTVETVGPAGIRVDARDGFAHPAIDLGLERLVPLARENGIAAMAVTNSYNCGVCGYHVERIAREGLVALGSVNAPASIASWGGSDPLFGTNPVSFAAPRASGAPLVLDQSSSVVANSEVVVHKQRKVLAMLADDRRRNVGRGRPGAMTLRDDTIDHPALDNARRGPGGPSDTIRA